jgi:CubicO group peptidase (beta-lactamase class C family)
MSVLRCLIVSGGLMSTAVFAQTTAPVGQSLPGLEAFDEAMQTIMKDSNYPGGTLVVAFQGRILLNKAYGNAKQGFSGSTPMAVDQRMRIASMSKLITSVAALKAAEQGKLDLDKPWLRSWATQPRLKTMPTLASGR